jgi:hypothetical protein
MGKIKEGIGEKKQVRSAGGLQLVDITADILRPEYGDKKCF